MDRIETINALAATYGPKIAVGLLLMAVAFLAAHLIRYILSRLFRKYEWAGRIGNLLATSV